VEAAPNTTAANIAPIIIMRFMFNPPVCVSLGRPALPAAHCWSASFKRSVVCLSLLDLSEMHLRCQFSSRICNHLGDNGLAQ
jgi:hypothetical protein